jgi:hypothetical protein
MLIKQLSKCIIEQHGNLLFLLSSIVVILQIVSLILRVFPNLWITYQYIVLMLSSKWYKYEFSHTVWIKLKIPKDNFKHNGQTALSIRDTRNRHILCFRKAITALTHNNVQLWGSTKMNKLYCIKGLDRYANKMQLSLEYYA